MMGKIRPTIWPEITQLGHFEIEIAQNNTPGAQMSGIGTGSFESGEDCGDWGRGWGWGWGGGFGRW